MEQTITLELTINEVNAILAGLSELPFKASADIIQKVRAASIAQLSPMPTPSPSDEEPN